jgi:hypothetical protein
MCPFHSVMESFSPKSGAPGTGIQIYGDNLKYVTSILFNGQPAGPWAVGPDPANIYLIALVPIAATSGPITVAGPSGSAASAESFTVIPSPPLTVRNWPVETEAGQTLVLAGGERHFLADGRATEWDQYWLFDHESESRVYQCPHQRRFRHALDDHGTACFFRLKLAGAAPR